MTLLGVARSMGRPIPTPRLLAVILVGALMLGAAGCLASPNGEEEDGPAGDPAPDPIILGFYEELASGREVRFDTTHGAVRLVLYEAWMPTTTARFAALVEEGFYDGTQIHRIVPRFVIQGGDPSGTGLLGSGETIPRERDPRLLFASGSMGLARDVDPDSGDSQWFVALTPQPHLSDPGSSTAQVFGTYALYAQVFAGMDVVRAIGATETIPGLDRPIDPPRVERAHLLPPPVDVDLLALPMTIEPRSELDGYAYDLEHPYHLFAGVPFPVAVHLRPDDDAATPPAGLTIRFDTASEKDPGAAGRTETLSLQPVAHDPWSFTGKALLRNGTWTATVLLGDQARPAHDLDVLAWHEAYERFPRTGGAS